MNKPKLDYEKLYREIIKLYYRNIVFIFIACSILKIIDSSFTKDIYFGCILILLMMLMINWINTKSS